MIPPSSPPAKQRRAEKKQAKEEDWKEKGKEKGETHFLPVHGQHMARRKYRRVYVFKNPSCTPRYLFRIRKQRRVLWTKCVGRDGSARHLHKDSVRNGGDRGNGGTPSKHANCCWFPSTLQVLTWRPDTLFIDTVRTRSRRYAVVWRSLMKISSES